MNIFYAPPDQIQHDVVELRGQEAIHATKVLRYCEGDEITVVDGGGNWYEGTIQFISGQIVRILQTQPAEQKSPRPDVILGMGIIKKRDRLEYAVEKAVELGVKAIVLFRSEHTVKKNPRMDRLETKVLSAMKQSLRAWRPELTVFKSLHEVLQKFEDCNITAAHQAETRSVGDLNVDNKRDILLLVGPEGGFSKTEVAEVEKSGGQLVSLGSSRLRTETAALTLLNHVNYWRLLNGF